MTDRMNAGVLSQLGSPQSSCVKRQQKQHTPQVCMRKCQQGSMYGLAIEKLVCDYGGRCSRVSCKGMDGVVTHQLLMLLSVPVPIQLLSVLHLHIVWIICGHSCRSLCEGKRR